MEHIPGCFIQDYPFILLLGCVTPCIFMQRVCNLGEVLNEASNMVYIVGSAYFAMALRLSLLGQTPFDETLCPKYSIFSLKNLHLSLGLSFSPHSLKHSRTVHRHSTCSSCVLEKMTTSSRYTEQVE